MKSVKTVKPLAVPEPCVIDELPEVVTVFDYLGFVYCDPSATLRGHPTDFECDRDVFDITTGCRWTVGVAGINRVAGVLS
jgi:hypothetical protein